MRLPLFIVAPTIVDFFEGEGPTRSLLAELHTSYRCTVCGLRGQLDTDTPATVIVEFYGELGGPMVVRLAHPRCSESGVVLVPQAPVPTGQMIVPAMAWLRSYRAEPPSVVVVAPRVRARRITAGGDVTDMILSGLLAAGFTLLTDPNGPLPVVPGALHVEFGNDQRITITNTAGNTLYDGNLPMPDGWAELIPATGLLGVVVVSGLDLLDHDCDHLADLFAAIGNGAAIGIAIEVDPCGRLYPARPALPPAE
jgi:hypothetical protein